MSLEERTATFRVDPDAEPGNVLPALARLLIDIDRRRSAQAQPPATTNQEQK